MLNQATHAYKLQCIWKEKILICVSGTWVSVDVIVTCDITNLHAAPSPPPAPPEKDFVACDILSFFRLLGFQNTSLHIVTSKGSRDGAVVRALVSHQCGLGSIPAQCYMWAEFIVGSRLAPRVLSGFFFLPHPSPLPPPPQKSASSNSNLTRMEDPHENHLRQLWLTL